MWNHKNIGTIYLLLSIIAGILCAVFSLFVWFQAHGLKDGLEYGLAQEPIQNGLIHDWLCGFALMFPIMHGIVMIFFIMLPALFCGLGNWLVPLMLGRKDTVFPLLEQIALWLFFVSYVGFLIFLLWGNHSFFGTSSCYWFGFIVILHLVSLSIICSSINFIVTILVASSKSQSQIAKSIFIWSILIAGFLLLATNPMMVSTLTFWLAQSKLLFMPEILATNVKGGDSLQLGSILLFVTYPAMYALLLPAFGMISHIISVVSNRPVFAQNAVILAIAVIGLSAFLLWTHTLFENVTTLDYDPGFLQHFLMIALPALFIIACWLMTLWRAEIQWTITMLWVSAFIIMFIFGIVFDLIASFLKEQTRLMIHFHYIFGLAVIFALFAGIYFWLPQITGLRIRGWIGQMHFWIFSGGCSLIFLSSYFKGIFKEESSLTGFIGMICLIISCCVFFIGLIDGFLIKKRSDRSIYT